MKILPRQINNFLKDPPKDITAVLFHGSDLGLISERSKNLALFFNKNLDDVFSVSTITNDMLTDDSIIFETAAQIPLFNDKRLVLVKGRGTELLKPCKMALSSKLESCMIIVEATEITSKHQLVKLFDASETAASIGCYPDTKENIIDLAKDLFSKDGIKCSKNVMDLIATRLGNDRATSRREIEKLALMAGPNGTLNSEDIIKSLGDNTVLTIDKIAHALASGNIKNLQKELNKAWYENVHAISILRGCQNYFRQICFASYSVENGSSPVSAVRDLRPPIHFLVQKQIQDQVRRWPSKGAMKVVNRIQDMERFVKSGTIDERIFTNQSLLGICIRASRF